jgi:hypothetical protein
MRGVLSRSHERRAIEMMGDRGGMMGADAARIR